MRIPTPTFSGLTTIDLRPFAQVPGKQATVIKAVQQAISQNIVEKLVGDKSNRELSGTYNIRVDNQQYPVFISSPYSRFTNSGGILDHLTMHQIYIATGTGKSARIVDQWLKDKLKQAYVDNGLMQVEDTLRSNPKTLYEYQDKGNIGRFCFDQAGNTLAEIAPENNINNQPGKQFGYFNTENNFSAYVRSNGMFVVLKNQGSRKGTVSPEFFQKNIRALLDNPNNPVATIPAPVKGNQ